MLSCTWHIFLSAASGGHKTPRYVKAVTCSRTSSPQVMFPLFAEDQILISLVFAALTLSPTLAACSWSASSFCLICAIFWLSKTRSSAKFRSSSFCNKVNWIPVLLSPKACRATQSSVTRKRRGLSRHPWQTPVVISNASVMSPSCRTFAWKPTWKTWIILIIFSGTR